MHLRSLAVCSLQQYGPVLHSRLAVDSHLYDDQSNIHDSIRDMAGNDAEITQGPDNDGPTLTELASRRRFSLSKNRGNCTIPVLQRPTPRIPL